MFVRNATGRDLSLRKCPKKVLRRLDLLQRTWPLVTLQGMLDLFYMLKMLSFFIAHFWFFRLPKKWSYCSKCSSSRSCTTCGGTGRIAGNNCEIFLTFVSLNKYISAKKLEIPFFWELSGFKFSMSVNLCFRSNRNKLNYWMGVYGVSDNGQE